MTPIRPDLVECWLFRVPAPGEAPQFLLLRRAPDRIFPGLWQCVTGGIEPGERVPEAALREVAEEVGFGPAEIEMAYDLDQVSQFYDESTDAIVSAAIFAARVRPTAEPRPSHEHDAHRWASRTEAARLAIWPTYAESMARIEDRLLDPETARWFALDEAGGRLARIPRKPA